MPASEFKDRAVFSLYGPGPGMFSPVILGTILLFQSVTMQAGRHGQNIFSQGRCQHLEVYQTFSLLRVRYSSG